MYLRHVHGCMNVTKVCLFHVKLVKNPFHVYNSFISTLIHFNTFDDEITVLSCSSCNFITYNFKRCFRFDVHVHVQCTLLCNDQFFKFVKETCPGK